MKKLLILTALFSLSAHAGPVETAINAMKSNDVRTETRVVKAGEEDGCSQVGDSIVDLQVRMAVRQDSGNGTIAIGHEWETVKTVLISPKGEVMEICAE